jgi:FkbM family methyltransferase
MGNISKKLAFKMLPDKVLHFVKKIHYARVLHSISEKEEPDLKVLKYLVGPGECVADVGANIGVYTKYLSEIVGASGRVFSVEPIPLTFDILRSNVRKLGSKNIELRNCAISDTVGQVIMEVPKYDSGGENFYESRIVREQADNHLRTVVIPASTIDSLVSGRPVHFIKCDTEGHELCCIQGALGTIRASKPSWLIEISSNPDDENSSAYQTFRILRESGYQAFWFDGAALRARRVQDTSVNYFFLTGEHRQVLQHKNFPIVDLV